MRATRASEVFDGWCGVSGAERSGIWTGTGSATAEQPDSRFPFHDSSLPNRPRGNPLDAPTRGIPRDSLHRRLARLRHWRPLRRRVEARHVRDARRRERGAARGPAALPHGRRLPGGSRRGRSARRRHVRLRRADANGAERHRVHEPMVASTCAGPSSRPTRGRSTRRATAPRANASHGPTSGISSSPTRSSGCALCRCTMYISWSRSCAARAPLIIDGSFDAWSRDWLARYHSRPTPVS